MQVGVNGLLKNGSTALMNAKRMIDEFVKRESLKPENERRTVADLGILDDEYRYIKNMKVFHFDSEGKKVKMKVEEIFTEIGHPRTPTYTIDLAEKLTKEATAYQNSGKSFHVKRKSLPFYSTLLAYHHSLHERGIDETPEQIMKRLGFREYSDTYYRFLGLEDLQYFTDEDGYVNPDVKMRTYLKSAGETLDMPYPLVVMLLCDKNMRGFFVDVDYIKYVRNGILELVEEHNLRGGDFSMQKVANLTPVLYNKFIHIQKHAFLGFEGSLTSDDTLRLIGLGHLAKEPAKGIVEHSRVPDEIDNLRQIANKNGGVLKRGQIDHATYTKIIKNSARMGIHADKYLEIYGIKYDGGVTSKGMFGRTYMTKYPYLEEMKARRDELLAESGVTLDNGFVKEEVFEKRVEVCKQVYDEFAGKIINCEMKALDKGEGKN